MSTRRQGYIKLPEPERGQSCPPSEVSPRLQQGCTASPPGKAAPGQKRGNGALDAALTRLGVAVLGLGLVLAGDISGLAGTRNDVRDFTRTIKPLLERYCYDCHADGANKGSVAFDGFQSDKAMLENHDLWLRALRNLRANLMPPAHKPQPTAEEQLLVENWIKRSVFRIDPQDPDPGRVTLRRLNRVEYQNTIGDLIGVNFDTQTAFPPDDSGHGFDNLGDVLTLPPMLLEKYVTAANKIVAEAVPSAARMVPERTLPGRSFRGAAEANATEGRSRRPGGLALSYERFFKRDVPEDLAGRRAYARELLSDFAGRAFRRPVDEASIKRLVGLAETVSRQPGKTFEAGISQAMVAILASPRFLFREERAVRASSGATHPDVDDYALASRLSYFLWSSMPDEELFRLAAAGQLRKNLNAQVERMFKDRRSEALIKDFAGQWLHTRDIEGIPLEARFILAREEKFDAQRTRDRARFRELNDKSTEQLAPAERDELSRLRNGFRNRSRQPPRAEMTGELRSAMRQETERTFAHVLREDRSLLELVDSDYTFLNERLATHYGIPDVKGDELRLVTLPSDSPRGGVLTQGTILGVTSNPTRTSPVKRGVFILENILGTPPPPPPPDIPPLEDAVKGVADRAPSLRETLALHRENALCRSCHNRMDPIGLAFENFNAMGMWRDKEYDEPIDSAGKLITGQEFTGVRELKRLLVREHAMDFYRTVTEKLLTYALGRGLEYYDTEAVDRIVERLRAAGGRPSALILGVVESAPFLKTRAATPGRPLQPIRPPQPRANVAAKRNL